LRGTSLAFTTAHTPTMLRVIRAGAAGCCPIAGNYYPHLYARLWRERDQRSASGLQTRLTALERIATRKYPLSAKHYLRRAGVPIGPRCRAVDYQWTAGDEAVLGRLQRQVQALGE
jgi:dihydrodipicolinate synthase/N-acetylneuraminate lyase